MLHSLSTLAVVAFLTGCSFKVLAPPPSIDLTPVKTVDSGKVGLEVAGATGMAGVLGFSGESWLARVGYGLNRNLTLSLRGSRLESGLDSALFEGRSTAGGLDLGSVGAGVRYGAARGRLAWTGGLAIDHEWSNLRASGMACTGELGLVGKTRWLWPFLALRATKVFPYKRWMVSSAHQQSDQGRNGIETLALTPTWWWTEEVGVSLKPDSTWDLWVGAGLFQAKSETSKSDGFALGVGIGKQF